MKCIPLDSSILNPTLENSSNESLRSNIKLSQFQILNFEYGAIKQNSVFSSSFSLLVVLVVVLVKGRMFFERK